MSIRMEILIQIQHPMEIRISTTQDGMMIHVVEVSMLL